MRRVFLSLLFVVLLLGLAALPCFGAIPVFDADSNGQLNEGSTFNFSHTVAAGSNLALVCGVSWKESAVSPSTISSITYNSVAMTLVVSRVRANVAGSNLSVALYRLLAPSTGANSFEVTFTEIDVFASAGCSSWTGVHQTTPFGASAEGDADDTSISNNVTSAADEVVLDAICVNSEPTDVTVGASQTSYYNAPDVPPASTHMTGAGSRETGAGTTTMSWSWTDSSNATQVAAPLKPAAATSSIGPVSTQLRRRRQ